jgi:hypothetical protein
LYVFQATADRELSTFGPYQLAQLGDETRLANAGVTDDEAK